MSRRTSTRSPRATRDARTIDSRPIAPTPTRWDALVAAFPDDLDAQTLYAEALMDLRPWNYWTRDGVAVSGDARDPGDARARAARVTRIIPVRCTCGFTCGSRPTRPSAPRRKRIACSRSCPAPATSSTCPRTSISASGGTRDVIRVNQLAAKADEDYIAQCRAQGLYPLAYYPHNLHFIWMGATASGQKAARARVGVSAGQRDSAGGARHGADSAGLHRRAVLGDGAVRRVGSASWPTTGPRHETPFTRGAWRYARAMALTAKDRLDEAEQELADARDAGRRPGAQRADDVLEQHRACDSAHRAGGGRR